MNTLKLLPRHFRFIGLLMVLPSIALFFVYPEVAFGDLPEFMSNRKEFLSVNAYNFLDYSYNELGEVSWVWFDPVKTDFLNEILLTLMLIGTYLISFSKIKEEDEFTKQLRFESMISAIVWNSLILLIANFLVYNGSFLFVMISQLFSFLLIFSLIFAIRLRKLKKGLANE